MPFVFRDDKGKIRRASMTEIPSAEMISHTDPELIAFLEQNGQNPETIGSALAELRRTDADMSRVVEDVVLVLLKKNLLKMTDLPKPVQDRMTTRSKLRIIIKDAYDQATGLAGKNVPVGG